MGNFLPAKITHRFQYKQTDCTIVTDLQDGINNALSQFQSDMNVLEEFVIQFPSWKDSYYPIHSTSLNQKNSVMELMEEDAELCKVGPMAAVAGALADRMCAAMLRLPDLGIAVVENGGEIAIQSKEEILIGLMVLSTSLQSQIGFKYAGTFQPFAVATSSATFGHADSLGEGDAVVVFTKRASLADAAATYICNHVRGTTPEKAIQKGLKAYGDVPQLDGVLIVKDNLIGQHGSLPALIRIKDEENLLLRKKIEKKEDYFPK
ncbi:MAG: UPF0280 family protein [Promethearchaeota archaeon]|nr:MAG: UPF0280 family protein [Candidatus Lokiarchaeota archaeon]